MKETAKKRTNNVQAKPTGRSERKGNKLQQENSGKTSSIKENQSKASNARLRHGTLVSDSNTGSELPEVYENVVIHYVDDLNRSEEMSQDSKSSDVTAKVNNDDIVNDSDMEMDTSDTETTKDSVSSQGDSLTTEDEKVERDSGAPRSVSNKKSSNSNAPGSRVRSDGVNNRAVSKTPKKHVKSDRVPSKVADKISSEKKSRNIQVPAKTEEVNNKKFKEIKETDVLDEASNADGSVESEDELVDAEETLIHEDDPALNEKIEEMEMRIEKLEEELREVAALEISLYSVVPEHGSSAHKVHTPARRLSRLYIHACKHWTQNKRATIAKNTISGLVLVAKSCGNDVSRLTFWLSNTIVLREIISQAFGSSRHSIPASKFPESNGSYVKPATLKSKGGASSKLANSFVHLVEDWQDTGTFTSALEKVESWIFSRMVESVWWQALTPYMQSPAEGSTASKKIGKLLGPALGDQQQGSFSINLWKNAFEDAFQRLCPVRAGGHDCGCLPVLARMVMEQCTARLDVAMFNAILRESANEIPTDPLSDPILDAKVLPIPAGDLSFGSGAQLKNSVGNWSRWLTDRLGSNNEDPVEEDEHASDDDFRHQGEGEPTPFALLNEFSDLLMLPKDMLMDRSIRMEVCPSISLSLVKRILCNFTPDEFCPDAVPGAVLEALNAESIVERRISGESARSFPYTAAPVVYTPPCTAHVAEKVAEAGERSLLSRNVSAIQRKGYTSDDELDELDSPLSSIIDKLPSSPTNNQNGNGKHEKTGHGGGNIRFRLLREVWSFT